MKLLSWFVLMLLLASPVAAELVSSITSPYLWVQVALAGDSTEGVSDAAEALAADAAETLAAADDIEAAREAFGALSDALIEYADSAGLAPFNKHRRCFLDRPNWSDIDWRHRK